MIIRVRGNELKAPFKKFLKKQNILCNFKIQDNILHVQLLDVYTVNFDCGINSIDKYDEFNEVTISIDKSILLLDNTDVEITIVGELVQIRQSAMCITSKAEYEPRRSFGEQTFERIDGAQLKLLVSNLIACEALQKELGLSSTEVVFHGGFVYTDYLTSMCIHAAPNMSCTMPLQILRGVLSDLTPSLMSFKDGVVCFKSEGFECYIPCGKISDEDRINVSIKGLINSMIPVCDISVKNHSQKLLLLSTVVKKSKLSFTVNEGHLCVSTMSPVMTLIVGDDVDERLLGIDITPAQLRVIASVFAKDETITVMKGGDHTICLASTNVMLLLSGVIY